MKKLLYPLFLITIIISCTSTKNSETFMKATSGRYLFNANEVLEIYFEDAEIHAKWRGNEDIELLKINDSAFYMKELNEKILFVSKPKMHIELAEKTEHKGIKYNFKKMEFDEKIASEYFIDKEFDKALVAFKKIQQEDSLDPAIREWSIRGLGYDFIRKDDLNSALEIFKINAELYPRSSNVFNSLGEAYYLKKDTVNALLNFKKSLAINPENRSSKQFMKKVTK